MPVKNEAVGDKALGGRQGWQYSFLRKCLSGLPYSTTNYEVVSTTCSTKQQAAKYTSIADSRQSVAKFLLLERVKLNAH